MTQDQFKRESGFRLALAMLKGMLRKGILTASEFEKARDGLISRFNPPYGGMTDLLAMPSIIALQAQYNMAVKG